MHSFPFGDPSATHKRPPPPFADMSSFEQVHAPLKRIKCTPPSPSNINFILNNTNDEDTHYKLENNNYNSWRSSQATPNTATLFHSHGPSQHTPSQHNIPSQHIPSQLIPSQLIPSQLIPSQLIPSQHAPSHSSRPYAHRPQFSPYPPHLPHSLAQNHPLQRHSQHSLPQSLQQQQPNHSQQLQQYHLPSYQSSIQAHHSHPRSEYHPALHPVPHNHHHPAHLQFAHPLAPSQVKREHSPSTPPSPPSTSELHPVDSQGPQVPSKVFKTHKSNTRYITIGEELLKMRQNDAARKLGIAPSTFSKRWRQTLPDRKWPFRQNVKQEKSIKTLKKFESKGHDISQEMEKLLKQKAENLREAHILIQNDDISEEYGDGPVDSTAYSKGEDDGED